MATKRQKAALLLTDTLDKVKDSYSSAPTNEEYHPHSKEGIALAKKSNALTIKLDHMNTIRALTPNQQLFFDAYNAGYYLNLLYGSAGTGKSMISIYKALEDVLSKDTPYEKLVIIRSAVASRDQGFLPGDLNSKMEVFEMPYISICADLFNRKDAYARLKEQGKIEFVSSSYLRGMTFNRSIVLFDEIQNESFENQYTAVTRCGNDTKLLLVGDYKQGDLNKSKYDVSGLGKLHSILKLMKEFTEIEFTTDDIVRSSMTKNFIIATEKWEKDNES